MNFSKYFVGNKPKGRISKWCFKKTKHVRFSENEHFYSLIRTRTVYGSENGFHIKEVLYYFTNPPKNMMVKSALGDLTFILLSKSHPVLGDMTEL